MRKSELFNFGIWIADFGLKRHRPKGLAQSVEAGDTLLSTTKEFSLKNAKHILINPPDFPHSTSFCLQQAIGSPRRVRFQGRIN